MYQTSSVELWLTRDSISAEGQGKIGDISKKAQDSTRLATKLAGGFYCIYT